MINFEMIFWNGLGARTGVAKWGAGLVLPRAPAPGQRVLGWGGGGSKKGFSFVFFLGFFFLVACFVVVPFLGLFWGPGGL